jgi:energy-coupling factor transport system permease protein
VLTLVGLTGVVVGLYGLLDATSPLLLGLPMLTAGVLCAAAALVVGARRDRRTHYRRDRWGVPEWLVCLTGAVPAVVLAVAASHAWLGVVPPQVPAALPTVPLGLVGAIAVGALAGVLAPVPPLLARSREAAR